MAEEHGRYCIRTDGDWKCGGGCRVDEVNAWEAKIADAYKHGVADERENVVTYLLEKAMFQWRAFLYAERALNSVIDAIRKKEHVPPEKNG